MKLRLAISTIVMVMAGMADGMAKAQTRSARDAATAYGARLNARGLPATLNPSRINNRVNSRLDSRLALRIERYQPDSTVNPTAAFVTSQDDRSRIAPVTTPPPQVDEPQ